MYLALNNLQCLICHKTKPNNIVTVIQNYFIYYNKHMYLIH